MEDLTPKEEWERVRDNSKLGIRERTGVLLKETGVRWTDSLARIKSLLA